jgi:mono/diheme cytochrome c family protein
MWAEKFNQLPGAIPRHLQLRRLNMPKPLLLLPAVVLLALGAASTASAAPQEGAKGAKPAAISARVKELYKIDCALCHNENGDGKTDLAKGMDLTLSDFTDPKTLAGKTDDVLFDLIRKGKDKMPGEDAGRAKNDEVKGLIEYIRGFSKNGPAATPASTPAPATPPASAAPSTPGSN